MVENRTNLDGTIICCMCKEAKTVDEYYKNKLYRCKICASKVAMEYYHSNKKGGVKSLEPLIIPNKRKRMTGDELKIKEMLDKVKLIKNTTPEMEKMTPKRVLYEDDGYWHWS